MKLVQKGTGGITPPSRLHNALFVLFIGGILAYGAGFAWTMLARFDLINLISNTHDDAFYYFQIASNLALGKFSTFDGGHHAHQRIPPDLAASDHAVPLGIQQGSGAVRHQGVRDHADRRRRGPRRRGRPAGAHAVGSDVRRAADALPHPLHDRRNGSGGGAVHAGPVHSQPPASSPEARRGGSGRWPRWPLPCPGCVWST